MLFARRYKNKITILCVLLAFAITLPSCAERYEENTYFALDTFIQTTLPEGASDDVYEYIKYLEGQFSKTDVASDIYKLNEKGKYSLPDTVLATVTEAVDISKNTGGSFDITLGAVTKLWDFKSEIPILPNENQISDALEHTGYKNISFDGKNVILTNGVLLDLGGIAKGAIAQYCVERLHENGIKTGLLNLGGNIAVVGAKENGEKWNIALRDPRDTDGSVGILSLDSGYISVSGDYERTFEYNEKTYHHILDPKNGYPVDNEICSVAVISNNGAQADALSTALFVMGLEEAMDFYLQEKYSFEAIIITKDKGVYLTDGAKSLFELTCESYKYKNF